MAMDLATSGTSGTTSSATPPCASSIGSAEPSLWHRFPVSIAPKVPPTCRLEGLHLYLVEPPMPRVLSYILVFAAMIVQIGMGVLPVGGGCVCIPVVRDMPACCCDEDSRPASVDTSCPCRDGCEHCICVPTRDDRATLSVRPGLNFGDDWVVVVTLLGTPAPLPVYGPLAIGDAPRATESPPHLAMVRTTRLTI